MGRREVDIGILRVVNTTPLAIGIVRGRQFREVVAGPCVDGHPEYGKVEEQEHDETKTVGSLSLLV